MSEYIILCREARVNDAVLRTNLRDERRNSGPIVRLCTVVEFHCAISHIGDNEWESVNERCNVCSWLRPSLQHGQRLLTYTLSMLSTCGTLAAFRVEHQ